MSRKLNRRDVMRGTAALGGTLAMSAYLPAWAQPVSRGIAKPLPTVSGTNIALTIDRMKLVMDGITTPAIGVNGTVPAPLVRLKEGQKVRLAVTNNLDEDSSIGSVAKIVKLEHAWRRLDGRNDDGFQVAPFPALVTDPWVG